MYWHGPDCLEGPVRRPNPWRAPNTSASHDSEVRFELVKRIRREIAQGIYETSEKLEIAFERLFDRIEPE